MSTIDVAIPCYQQGRFLRNCVESVADQGISGLRILIVDNASTDDSIEAARELAARDRRIEVLRHPTNLGHHASFNEAIDWASSRYFLLLCADDLLTPGALTRAVSVMESHPRVVLTHGRVHSLHSRDSFFFPSGQVGGAGWRISTGSAFIERSCRTAMCLVPGSTAVVRTDAQKRAGHYRPHLRHTDDVELWLRIALLGDTAETDAVQGVARIHETNRSAAVRAAHIRDLRNCEAAFDSFFAREGASLPEARRLHKLAKRSLASRAYWSAVSHLARGHPGQARELLRMAARLRPATLMIPPLAHLVRDGRARRRMAAAAAEAAARLRWPASDNRAG